MVAAIRLFVLTVFAGMATGCASYEGVYEPGCIVYAGDRVKLDGGRFVWEKFTDQVLIDKAGNKIEFFPEYPVLGRYELEQERLSFNSHTGEELPDMYLRSEGSRYYLLTAGEHLQWEETGSAPDCPLVRSAD